MESMKLLELLKKHSNGWSERVKRYYDNGMVLSDAKRAATADCLALIQNSFSLKTQ